ncbi:MAG TPA: winged helix-turn-helix domain-containing protein [Solirubrobacteraceae bacterium]|jgi:predicted ArsR family transcriptional regulator
MVRSADKPPRWVFLSNHAHVLLCIARDPDSRTRDLAEQVGITERAAQRIVSELVAERYLKRTKIGRRNRYEVNRHGHLRSAPFKDFEIGPLLDVLNTADGARRTQIANSPPESHRPSAADQASPPSRKTRRTVT